MQHVLMSLGGFHFSLKTAAYETLTRTADWRWPKQERIGREPALQYVGPGAETIKMEGALYPPFTGKAGEIGKLRAAAAAGEPLTLVDGRGNVWGKYVIVKLDEKSSALLADGSAREIKFTIDLMRYGDDRGG